MTELTVTMPTDREIVLTRSFTAPARLVFDAFTQPSLLTRWYGARGWNLVACSVDLREGGRYRFESAGPQGETMAQSGTYRIVQPCSRLVYTELFDDQSYDGESVITHVFTEDSSRTTVTTTVLYATAAGLETVRRYPMARGVTESYERLDVVLAG
jgi:uncharacterized protein YndB with AHSA1/START domain